MKTEQGPPPTNIQTTMQTAPPVLEVDLMEFAEHLEGSGLTDAEMQDYLSIFWGIVIAFVDLGFGLHPAQIACEKLIEDSEKASFLTADSLDSKQFTDSIEKGVKL